MDNGAAETTEDKLMKSILEMPRAKGRALRTPLEEEEEEEGEESFATRVRAVAAAICLLVDDDDDDELDLCGGKKLWVTDEAEFGP